MFVASKSNTLHVRRQSADRHDVRILRRFLGDVVEIYVTGARPFAGTITAIDGRARLLQMDQLGDGRSVIVRLDAIAAVEQHLADDVWALVPSEGAA